MINNAWVIRAGVKGSADNYFLNSNRIVLNDPGLGNLTHIEPNRQAFYYAYRIIRPNETRTSIAGVGGKFFRFIHEMQVGDIVLYPSLITHDIYVGEITGKYSYVEQDTEFPHQRRVKWIASFPKKSLSKPAKYELGAARTLFKYKKHINEIIYKI